MIVMYLEWRSQEAVWTPRDRLDRPLCQASGPTIGSTGVSIYILIHSYLLDTKSWLFVVGPFMGGGLATLLYWQLFQTKEAPKVNYTQFDNAGGDEAHTVDLEAESSQ